jgi:tRNA-dihydrouridine synthase B
VRDIILGHLGSLYAFYGEDSGVRIARKHLGWYCEQLLADSAQIRRSLMAASTTSAQFALAHDHLEDWVVDRGTRRPAGTLAG